MANEIVFKRDSSKDYAIVIRAIDDDYNVWKVAATAVFETFGTSGRTRLDYGINATDAFGDGTFAVGMPAGINTAYKLLIEIYIRAGASLADDDLLDGSFIIEWDGSAVLAAGANIIEISGDSTAANNLELQYSGDGLLGDSFPLRQDQGAGIAGGLAIHTTMTSVTVIQGSEQDLDNANTSDDGRWTGDDDGSGAEFIFRCTPVDTDSVPVDLHFEGYYDEPSGASNGATMRIYDFQNEQWDTILTFSNKSKDEVHDVAISHINKAPGSGIVTVNAVDVNYTIGDVLLKFKQDTQETGNACLLIDYMTVGYVGSLITANEIRDAILDDATRFSGADVSTIEDTISKIDPMIDEDSAGNQFTVAALQNAPTAEMDATELAYAMKAITGITVGGDWTWGKVMKINAAWIAGNWRVKPTDSTKQELMDAEDNTEIILEQTLSKTTPYRTIEVKI